MQDCKIVIIVHSLSCKSAGTQVLLKLANMIFALHHDTTVFSIEKIKSTSDICINPDCKVVSESDIRSRNADIIIFGESLSVARLRTIFNKCNYFVRYNLFYQKALNPFVCLQPVDLEIFYTRTLLKKNIYNYSSNSMILHIPVDVDCNTSIVDFNLRKGESAYASKNMDIYLSSRYSGLDNLKNISREAYLLKIKSLKCVYVFEDTSVTLDCIVVGTPCILVKSDRYTEFLAEVEYRNLGWCYSDEEQDLFSMHKEAELACDRLKNLDQASTKLVGELLDKIRKEYTHTIKSPIYYASSNSLFSYLMRFRWYRIYLFYGPLFLIFKFFNKTIRYWNSTWLKIK